MPISAVNSLEISAVIQAVCNVAAGVVAMRVFEHFEEGTGARKGRVSAVYRSGECRAPMAPDALGMQASRARCVAAAAKRNKAQQKKQRKPKGQQQRVDLGEQPPPARC